MMRGRAFFFMLLMVSVMYLSVVAVPVQAAQLRVECPEVIGIGLPFVVKVESDEPLDKIRVEWAGKALQRPGKRAPAWNFCSAPT